MDSIIFDLDGTLWDSSREILTCWNDVLARYDEVNYSITVDDLTGTMGLQSKEIGEKLFPHLGSSLQQRILAECCQVECNHLANHGGVLYDRVEEVLSELSQTYKLFIVSNCQDGYIEAFYKYHKLDKYFIDYENPGRTGLSKGENIKLVINRNQLVDPIYVGDTEGDRTAAKFAGIPFVFAKYGFGEVTQYDYSVDTFDAIKEL
ncbi:HAD family hydrolase [Cytobacillus sp. IB215665]|uniref:HAD family hydrolase n=1 Tax=Cytobacillus sp. IB215665 TaxID=3097357 RepID=UPI002A0B1439|nr:HAD family hydrolase [Cytobacillus sp. IB215665]MDX8367060.1 HAD family hydrolase [Cytobacillus sp. IB215665]